MTRSFRYFILALGLAVFHAPAGADGVDDRWYLAPTISHVLADGDRGSDDGWGLGLALGKSLNEKWNMEYALRGNSLNRNAGGSYDQYGLGVDGLYFFKRNPGFAPFAVVGAGYLRTDIPGNSDNSLMANAGLGFLKRLSDDMDLRADARYRWAGNDLPGINGGSLGDWVISIGLNIPLGAKTPMPVAREARIEPTRARVESAPATRPEVAPSLAISEAKREPVPDRAMPAAKPEPMPQPLVAPPTPAAVATQLEQAKSGDAVVVLRGVNFDFDSARLRPDALAILDEAARVLAQRGTLKVDIVGHTCSIGTEKYNQGLSERRARSVHDYFIAKELKASRFSVKGHGETRPTADNTTRAGRERNRRVELHILD